MKGKPVILVVDDQPQNIELLEAYLALEGYEIVKATNGEEALEKLSGNQIDLILLDVLMPGMDGFEVTRRVRQDNTHRLLPIILVTVLRETEDRVKGIEAGCDDFISSPVDKIELLARVRSLLKIKAYNELMSNYREELESEVTRRTEELKQALEHLQQDMTQRKLAEEALRESEAKYRLLIDTADESIVVAQDGLLKFVNPMAIGLLGGYSEQELMDRPFPEFIHPDDRSMVVENYRRRIANEAVQPRYSFRVVTRDGIVKWVEINAVLIEWQGKPATLNFLTDITQRKRAEEELRRMNAFLDSIVENIPNMIFLKDAKELRFVRFNRAGEDLLGFTRDDLLGKNDYDFFPKKQADFFTEKDREVLHGKEVVDIPKEPIQTRNKGERIMHTKKVPILDANGEPEYLLGISEDITERKEAEDKLQHTLNSLRKAVSATTQVLVSAVEARDPYTSGHQTRSADLARAIATEMKLSQDKIEGVRVAGTIHDIGKLSIPAEILSKPAKLTEIEFSLIKEHAKKGYEILKDVESPWRLAEIVYQHHERMNGSGYPRNLKGDDILMEARILAVADVVEAMASHRPYRPSLGIDAAMEEIEKNRGILYDIDVADACLRLFRENGYQLPSGGVISYGRIGI
jgi:PAS domain S-box-containing protein/putative nucleotidyltransferase with HDIG domain